MSMLLSMSGLQPWFEGALPLLWIIANQHIDWPTWFVRLGKTRALR